ncbi:hypothetical protein [Erythrobacter sp. JK5]|uniref:hypothetical protein n=1 Tax=Erythrobacter sp. JK5 TaxID=2829500 RepID=UPI001BA465C5|nr:hypothetical protein [Erythrobacter sp. JK5]QUL36556.1 hypothetical protein KDC96_08880 [Erythrobacter sp. JK5]
MKSPRLRAIATALCALVLPGCSDAETPAPEAPAASAIPREPLGLMTSLPLYWPLGADFSELAQGGGERPWQRALLERRFELVPLDTLSPIPGLSPGDRETDPLAGLERLAVIQPRGLSAADNVALDDWVRGGGELLLVLDPILSGDYDVPLGDPRRPVDTALIPPVLKRWGLAITAELHENRDEGIRTVALGNGQITVVHSGTIAPVTGNSACEILAQGTLARCTIGQGRVTVLADAALFEHRDLAGERGEHQSRVLDAAFSGQDRG